MKTYKYICFVYAEHKLFTVVLVDFNKNFIYRIVDIDL